MMINLIDCKFNPFFPYNNTFIGKTFESLHTNAVGTGVVKLRDKA